jgi:hypothetical protein
LLAAGLAVAAIGLRNRATRLTLIGVVTTGIALLASLTSVAAIFDAGSTKQLAAIIVPRLKPEDQVYCLRMYPQDLPVYLNRMISVVAFQGELQYGIDAEPDLSSKRFLTRDAFWAEWKEPGNHYAVLREAEYQMWFPEGVPNTKIGSSNKLILVSSCQ